MTETSDALSDVLRLVRLRACVYFVKTMALGWGIDAPPTVNGPLHMVLEGRCVLRHGGKETELQAGDAVLLPRGAATRCWTRPMHGRNRARRRCNV